MFGHLLPTAYVVRDGRLDFHFVCLFTPGGGVPQPGQDGGTPSSLQGGGVPRPGPDRGVPQGTPLPGMRYPPSKALTGDGVSPQPGPDREYLRPGPHRGFPPGQGWVPPPPVRTTEGVAVSIPLAFMQEDFFILWYFRFHFCFRLALINPLSAYMEA